ncbi:HNH endonuclease signature motif containing protein [Corynebacterium lipophiloflavum]|uniref:HNH endonuclease domain protein n=1 Tax=Corynebacterium lipophiloflavum (strain ATCC 700352 / DSM 44291 / CCUG 37336 / JCM 10383 / DMMZ 1944) TaxID=525263 RepID=C0XUS6_CORLD|nr:HNH endonuclease signature motif containing protein [Corynebacterium lipophiloflavum]EEI15992.1 HNH endonuclease domain protein [Corynebacterium lipophiloflavum DSM 44291]
MENTTQHPDQAEYFFRTQRPGDAVAALGQRKRDADFELFSEWADPAHCVDDFELEVTTLQEAVGESRSAIEKAIFAYRRLSDLPRLRSTQSTTRVLDIKRLAAIDNVIAELGPELSQEVLQLIDAYLTDAFTPRKANQPLLSPKALTHRLKRFIAKFDERVDYDPKKRKDRAKAAGDFTLFEYSAGKRSGLTVECDNTTHAVIREFRRQVAREHKVSEDEAAKLILTGRITTQPKVTIFGYAPLTPEGDVVDGASVYFPGSGWTDAAGTAEFDNLTDANPPRIIDLDDVAEHEIAGYVPSTSMRAYAIARDGVCIWPGCDRDAHDCQMDHRIPYQEDGATTPSNLFSLCHRHHNVKTDRRAFYVPDPLTGDIVWLFPDGTYQLSQPEGFIGEHLSPHNPRWNIDLDSRLRERDRVKTFFARGHKILDDFDLTHNVHACMQALVDLESEFGMTFPFEPLLPEDEDIDVDVALLIANDPYLRYGDAIY